MKKNYIYKEISWLSFNARVLQEANDPSNPLIERLKFLGIYSSNLDEYFRVRVATLKRLIPLGKRAIEFIGADPKKLIKEIHEIVMNQKNEFEIIYEKIKKTFVLQNIFIINEKNLSEQQSSYVKNYFHNKVRQKLMPIMLDKPNSTLILKDDTIYLAICMSKTGTEKVHYSLMEVPTDTISRFLVLPEENDKKFIILLDDVIRHGLDDIFYIFDYDYIEAYTIKITKDAEFDINDDVTEGILKNITQRIKQRKEGSPVRLVYDEEIPKTLLSLIIGKLKIKKMDAIISGGRYHNFKDFIKFPKLGRKELFYTTYPTISHKQITPRTNIFSIIDKNDLLIHFPYHSFDNFIDFLREASIDPKVISIKISIYRLSKKSAVINALINAHKNGKSVTVVVELQARFDEEANIFWSNKLKEEGIKVIYGVPTLKVHAKLCLITRKENNHTSYYASVSTGNFNEDTSKNYNDHLLLTSDKRITGDILKLFDFFKSNYLHCHFSHLIVSPFFTRTKFVSLIKNEIKNAKAGKKAFIFLKMNNLTDPDMIKLLYEASQSGVKILINVRGMLSLIPEIKGLSENIYARGIVGRILEHSRIFIFCNNGQEKYFISSADWMTRNIDRRVEVTCPIYDKNIQKELKAIFDLQWKDNLKSRIYNQDQDNQYYRNNKKNKINSQYAIYDYLTDLQQKNSY